MVPFIRNWGAWLLGLIGIVAYFNALSAPLIFDDVATVETNVYVHSLWPPRWFLCSPGESPLSSRPVVALTFALNYAMAGLDPVGMRLVNVAIHIASAIVLNAWLVVILTRARLPSGGVAQGQKRATNQTTNPEMIAWCLSALWLIHPQQTDAVTYITQRTELLLGLAYFGVMFTAARAPDERWSGWHSACVLIGLLGVGCKEVMATAPLMVVLADRALRYESWRETWRRRWPLYLGLVATWLPLAGFMWLSPRGQSAGFGLGVTPWQYLLTQCHAIPIYLRQTIWPTDLNIDHGVRIRDSLVEAVPGGLLLLTLAGITIWGWFARPVIGFIGAWFFVILGPSSSIIPIVTEVAAERRMHLPLLAVIVSLAFVGQVVCERLQLWRGWSHESVRPATAIAVAALIVVFSALTIQRNYDYRSFESIWYASLEQEPNNPRAYYSLAEYYLRHKDMVDFERVARAGVAIDPGHDYYDPGHYFPTVKLLCAMLHAQERHTEADQVLAKALDFLPNHVGVLLYAGQTASKLERLAEAEAYFRRAAIANPENALAFNELAGVLVRQMRFREALEFGLQAVKLDPRNALMRENLGLLLANLDRKQEATEQLREAVRLDSTRKAAQAWLDEQAVTRQR
jgi:Tfp pilus assembly protein PilF